MRSAASTTLVRGRHRWGRPGLVHVSTFVTVAYRGLFAAWRTPGKHRHHHAVPPVRPATPEPVPAI